MCENDGILDLLCPSCVVMTIHEGFYGRLYPDICPTPGNDVTLQCSKKTGQFYLPAMKFNHP